MKKIVLILLSLVIFFFVGVGLIHADECADKGNLSDKITCYQSKISTLSSQSKTLSNQIAQFDAQIKLTTLKISQTEEQINLLAGRIDRLEVSLEALNQAFSVRAVETYKMARVGEPFLVLISSQGLSEAMQKFAYLQKIQEADQDLIKKLNEAQTTYKAEKTDQEELQTKLEKEKQNLSVQKSSKAALLTQTKNEEKNYQQLLAQAYAEKAALEAALVAGTKVGPVGKGDPIALVGNSGYPGCSTGKHLHFEIRKDNAWTDPGAFLQSRSVKNEQDGSGNMMNLGSGSWNWPIDDTVRITQFYGHTPYSWRYAYSGGIHTGLDMVSTSSDVIRAPADGTLYRSSQLCGTSSVINVAYVEHGDGLISFYLHVQ